MMHLLFPLLLAAAAPAPKQEVRTLDAITIEGEAAVPQVLFITSREHPRHPDFLEDLGRHFRRTALDIARGAPSPRRFVISHDCVTAEIKEQ